MQIIKDTLCRKISIMNEAEQRQVCGILSAKMPSSNAARRNAESMRDCPWSIMTGASDDNYYAIFIVPRDKSWRLDYLKESPEVIGALDVTVIDVNDVFLPNQTRITQNNYDSPPCGADCRKCPLQETYNCEGCPAVRS